MIGGAVTIFASVVFGISVGATGIGIADVWPSIAHTFGIAHGEPDPITSAILWQGRAPRAVLAIIVGAGLGVSGAVLQTLTRNPLADPYLLGVSSGASAGAVTVVLFGIALGSGLFALAMGAFVGSLIAFALVLLLVGRSMDNPLRVVLSGVAVSQFFAALTSLILMSNADADSTQAVVAWMLGSLASAGWPSVIFAAVVLTVLGSVIWLFSGALNALVFGRETARTLGIDSRKVTFLLFTLTALLTAAMVAVSGAIGFVGLISPHIARFLGARTHRWLLPTSALIGALFLVWADVVSRSVFSPQQIPVGVVTALIGVPVFAVILRRNAKGRS
nr:iron chelate uptake ABC transporter family permease subunit [Leucobacter exalbidus]